MESTPLNATAVPVQFTPDFLSGRKRVSFRLCESWDLPSMTTLKVSPGAGKELIRK